MRSSSIPMFVRRILTASALFACFFVSSVFAESSSASPSSDIEHLVSGYYQQYPETQAVQGEAAKRIQRGEYIAKMGDCIACHTNVKEKTGAFAGGLPLVTPFGTFYSPNITPDKETGIGLWSEDDFIRAMRDGRDPHGRNYFPVFPYIYFSKMKEEDIKDLYAYLMAIPAIKHENKPLPFPFNLPGVRTTLWGWNLLFFFPDDNSIPYNKAKSPEWNRGKYIVDTLGHCSMCHTPLNVFGAPKNRYYLTGAFIDGYWAPNITKQGLDGATKKEIAHVFKHNELLNGAGPVAGPMMEVNHNSLMHLTDEDRLAIATYLQTVDTPDPHSLPPVYDKPSLERGKQVYVSACIICHQDNIMSAPVIWDGSNWYRRLKSSGLTGLYQHAIKGFNSMPIKGACVTCSDNDIISATDYILNKSLSRSQWRDLLSAGIDKYRPDGEAVYQQTCAVCHNEGKDGAPKVGDASAWSPILKNNMDTILSNTLSSDKHPKRGGCENCSTGEILEAIKYMISKSKESGNYSLW